MDTETLVVFDFDSILYNKRNWKIVNPKIGKVGSLKDLLWVLNFYKERKYTENFDLFSYCIPELEEILSIPKQQIERENYNFFPLEKIQEMITNHKLNRRRMIFLTLILSSRIQEIIFNVLGSDLSNSLYPIEWVQCWIDKEINIQNYDFPRLSRFLYIKSLLKKKETTEEEKIQTLLTQKYQKIYYYTTDPILIEILKKHLLENYHIYKYKTNAIIAYLFVKKIII